MPQLHSIAAAALLAVASPAFAQEPAPDRPLVDHHQHLMSPSVAAHWTAPARAAPSLSSDLAAVIGALEQNWNQASRLAPLYAEDAVLMSTNGGDYISGRQNVAAAVADTFGRPYRIVPASVREQGANATIAAYLQRGEGAAARSFGYALYTLAREGDAWRVTSQTYRFPGPPSIEPLDADALVQLLDQAGIQRAVVLSMAYALASPLTPPAADERAAVAAENNWTAAQAARHSDRLVGFCAVNPLRDYAEAEIDRCVRELGLRGLKLHFANSGIDLRNAGHVARLRSVFAAANRHRIPIVAHLWVPSPNYGAEDARIFLDQILPAAPDIVVQIAHMAGAGPGWNDEALAVFAGAIEARDRRTRRLYFDIATVADEQSLEDLAQLAGRIRQIGTARILYGSDAAGSGRNPPAVEWANFRGAVPLTDEEFAIIRRNVAPYLR